MTGNSAPPHQPNILRKPDKKPVDFRATSQQQSNAGTYDERGGNRLKIAVAIVVLVVVIGLAATFIIDAFAGRETV